MTNVPGQALYLLNDSLVHEQSRRFALRVLADAADDSGRVQRAYELALARPADSDEIEAALGFLTAARGRLSSTDCSVEQCEAQSWQALVRVILRLNEFVYLD